MAIPAQHTRGEEPSVLHHVPHVEKRDARKAQNSRNLSSYSEFTTITPPAIGIQEKNRIVSQP